MMNWYVFLCDKKMLKELYVLFVFLLMLDFLIIVDGKYFLFLKLLVSNFGMILMFYSFCFNCKLMRSIYIYLKKEIYLC